MSLEFDGTSGVTIGAIGNSSPLNFTLSYPFALSCWFFPTNTTGTKDLVHVRQSVGPASYWLGTSGTSVVASTWNGTISVTASRAGININRWNQAIARFNSNTQRLVHINGSIGTINTTSSGQGTNQQIDTLILGVADGAQRFFTGYMAHVAIWNADLSDSDSASLGRGASPLSVRPANLVAYYPIVAPGAQINIASAKSRGAQPLPTLGNARYSNWNPPVKTVLPKRTLRVVSSTSSSNVTVAVTGEALATTLGSVTAVYDANVAVTGEALATTLGSVTAVSDATVAVTGEAIATTLGSVTAVYDANVAVTGEALATTLGSVTAVSDATVAVTGEALATTLGSVTAVYDANVAVTGEALATTLGAVTAGSNATVAITGEALTTTLGSVTAVYDANVAVTGESLATTLGAVTTVSDATVAVTGEALATTLGDVAATQNATATLTGEALATTLESVTAAISIDVAVTGQALTLSLGDVSVDLSIVVNVSSLPLLNTSLGYVTVWGVINDNQTPNWIPVVDTQGASWGPISDTQTPNWAPVIDTQGPSWGPIIDAQDPNWTA